MSTRYKILTTKKEVRQLIKACKKTGYCCFDFETNAAKIYSDNFYPTILSISYQVGSGLCIPLGHFDSSFKTNWKKLLVYFGRRVIENPNITKVAWNWKFDQQIMMKYGIYNKGRVIDGMLAKYILNEERPNGLKDMVGLYLPKYSGYEDYEGSKLPWDKKPLEPLAKYGCLDTDMTLRLSLFFEKKLIDLGFYSLYRNLIMMASRVLLDAEKNGMRLDIPFNDALIVKYSTLIKETEDKLKNNKKVIKFERALIQERKEKYIEKLESEIENLDNERSINSRREKIARIIAGDFQTKTEKKLVEPINFKSQPQMVQLFYTHHKGFKFPIVKYTKKDKKDTTNPSTSEDTLIELKNHDKYGFIDTLLELRGLQTINSTFVLGLRENLCEDGRIHPKFNIHGTVTGRLSSNDPNFQNLPRPTTNPDIKKMMIPEEGKLFLMMDYAQAELRVLAHMAKEETLLEWFRTGKDIHLASACKKYHEDYDEILKIYKDEQHPLYITWKKRRKQAKTINFGIAYEQTAMKLSESLSEPDAPVSKEEAQVFLDDFFRDFPKIKKYIEKQHKLAEKQGFVKTLFGRKRRLPNVWSDNYREYLEALRFSSNAPIQGTASDFALFSSILIWENVRLGHLPELKEVTTVHDSLVFEVDPKDITKELIHKMWSICKNPETKKYFNFEVNDVSMDMDFGVGRTYAEELPFVPGYNYENLLSESFNKDEYYAMHKKYADTPISSYPNLKLAS